MNTYRKCACNSSEMNTYKIIGLKTPQNEHLQENGRGVPPSAVPALTGSGQAAILESDTDIYAPHLL